MFELNLRITWDEQNGMYEAKAKLGKGRRAERAKANGNSVREAIEEVLYSIEELELGALEVGDLEDEDGS